MLREASIEADRAVEYHHGSVDLPPYGVKRALPWIAGVRRADRVLVVGLSRPAAATRPQATAAPFDLQTATRELAGSPAPLAALHAQSAELLEGGVPAFESRLARAQGHPVVINKWASWCNPCRAEFPAFQQVATERGKRDRVPRPQRRRQHGAGAASSSRSSRVPSRPTSTRTRRSRAGIEAPAELPRSPSSSTRDGKTAFIHQGGYTLGAAARGRHRPLPRR